MTVRRNALQSYQLDRATLTAQIREIVNSKTLYTKVQEVTNTNETIFNTTLRPKLPALLSTQLSIIVNGDAKQSVVQISVKSQSFIEGDIFGMYDQYTSDFFSNLRESINDISTIAISPTIPRPTGDNINRFALVYLPVAIMSLVLYLVLWSPLGTGLDGLPLIDWFFIAAIVLFAIAFVFYLVKALHHR